jgi:predicted RNase H-like nuclease
VAASSSIDLANVTFTLVAEHQLRSFLAPLAGTCAVVAIDVPIGLAEREARACDQAARVRLGAPRQNSVFSAPCRGTLAATDYLQACSINRGLRGRAISRQSWGIVKKIASVDVLLDELPRLAPQIWEAHPEVTFAELAATPLGIRAPKKSASGLGQRLALLEAHGLHLDLERVRLELYGLKVARDDIVDSAACLLTAARVACGQATFLPPGPPPFDVRGRRMQIAA